tara:strand:+ start:490 stop:1323 length:834 start_codon:yes stop_codon:yes gene_type:complete
MSKYNLTDLAEGMGYKEYEDAEEANRLEKHPERDTIKKIQALMAKEKSLEEDAVDLAVEASQAKAGIKEDEDEDRKNDEDYEEGWADDPRIDEVRIDRDVAERIEGLTNRELKRKFLFAFEDLYSDLIEEDPFHAEDVINHLNNEMHKHLSSFQNTGDKFAGIEETDDFYDELEEGAMQPGEADLESGQTGNMDAYTEEIKGGKVSMKDAVLAIIKDTSATNPEIQMYVDSLTNDIKLNGKEAYADYEIDDYIEDFKEFIGNKSLQEHFGRFMKDYQ